MRLIARVTVTFTLACCLAASSTADTEAAGEVGLARSIIDSSGVRAGLCVQLGVTDGRLAAELAGAGRFIVHGIALTRDATEKAREYAASRNLHGTVSIERGNLSKLPYADGIVNLVVVDDLAGATKNGLSLGELMRVLCPNGAVYLAQKGQTGKAMLKASSLKARLAKAGVKDFEIVQSDATSAVIRKNRPAGTDEWTHWLHGPECNNLSSDSLAGPGTQLQWIDGPIWMVGANVTELFANGRSFNVMRELQGKWTRMIGRDAYNGLVLWELEIEVSNPRLFVAVGEAVFAVLKTGGPLVALDAATGKIFKTYDVGFSPLCVLYQDGNLILGSEKEVCSVNAETGDTNWRKTPPRNANFILQHSGPLPQILYRPPYMVAGDGQLFVLVKDAARPPYTLISYDLASGQERRSKKQAGELLAYYKGLVMLYEVQSTTKPERRKHQETGAYHAISSADGRVVWSRPDSRSSYHGIWDDLSYGGGLIWLADGKRFIGLDPATGKERKSFKRVPRGHCGRIATTDQYAIATMSDFYSLESGRLTRPGFYKNGCNVGQLPANGMIYTFPISCACIAYIRGHIAIAPASASQGDVSVTSKADRLEKGPAYGFKPSRTQPAPQQEWNTYRRDIQRSGATPDQLPRNLKLLWSESVTDQAQTPHGRTITPPVVAEGKVFIAATDAQQVTALDAKTGKLVWRYLLGGRVEAAPTIYRGLCLFGANDGWVYCLRADDGKLIWRFNAAPGERRIVAYGRVESAWPIPGVLVSKGVAYFAAGRHSKTANGISVHAVDPFTGKILWTNHLDRTKLKGWSDNHVNDLLVGNDETIFMGHLMFDLSSGQENRTWSMKNSFGNKKWKYDYLVSGKGRDTPSLFPFAFLYDRKHGSELERYDSTHWSYKDVMGTMLAFRDDTIFGVDATRKMRRNIELFARKFDSAGDSQKVTSIWVKKLPRGSIQAILLAGPTLLVAGPGAQGGMLGTYSAADGSKLSELQFDDAPIFDGLAATGGRVYVSTQSGKVFCFAGK